MSLIFFLFARVVLDLCGTEGETPAAEGGARLGTGVLTSARSGISTAGVG